MGVKFTSPGEMGAQFASRDFSMPASAPDPEAPDPEARARRRQRLFRQNPEFIRREQRRLLGTEGVLEQARAGTLTGYHGTRYAALEGILRHGFDSTLGTAMHKRTIAGHVFFAPATSGQCLYISRKSWQWDEPAVVVEILFTDELLARTYPDPPVLWGRRFSTRGRDPLRRFGITAYFKAKPERLEQERHRWPRSFVRGAVAVRGGIPVENVVRVALIDWKSADKFGALVDEDVNARKRSWNQRGGLPKRTRWAPYLLPYLFIGRSLYNGRSLTSELRADGAEAWCDDLEEGRGIAVADCRSKTIALGAEFPVAIIPEALATYRRVPWRARQTMRGPSADARKIGRNDPCSCGSGRKFKKCCLGGRAAG